MRLRSLLAAVLLWLVLTLLPAAASEARTPGGGASPPSRLCRAGSATLRGDHRNRLAVVARRPAARASAAEALFPGGGDAPGFAGSVRARTPLPPRHAAGEPLPSRSGRRAAPPACPADLSARRAPRAPPRLP